METKKNKKLAEEENLEHGSDVLTDELVVQGFKGWQLRRLVEFEMEWRLLVVFERHVDAFTLVR